jgi:hypothetical protein
MGRPGLVGTAARTAVIAGTATAVSGKVAQSQHDKAVAAQQQAAPPPPAPVAAAPAPAPVAAAPAGAPDLMEQLTKLGEMKGAGLLSDEEFTAAKAKLLA